MRYSQLFGKAIKETSKKYESLSHELLTKAGFIYQVASGIYNILPLGKRVMAKIEQIIRQEMNTIGGQEITMPLLHPKTLWEKTNRWQTLDVLFKSKSRFGQEYALAPTHEETVVPLAKKWIKSYRDLPLYLYHITEKFRDEPRPKSGILRGREFGMKDLYSFHENYEDFISFYQKVIKAYLKIFRRCGLSDIRITEASGGSFTKKHSHEFNVLTEAGEVDLIYCQNCDFTQNKEICQRKNGDLCQKCNQGRLKAGKAIEVGNIFDLGARFAEAFGVTFVSRDGQLHFPIMGCYGIGTSRLLGAIVEINNDEKGIIWPKEVTPYQCHLINIRNLRDLSDLVYRSLKAEKIDVLYDDRENTSGGEKLMTADLIGIPIRLIVSEKTKDKVEWKERTEEKKKFLSISETIKKLKKFYENHCYPYLS